LAILISALLILPMAGCSGSRVAQNIVNWTPALQSAVATVNSTAALLDPKDAPVFIVATAGFDAASNILVAQARAYLANPNVNVLAQLQTAVVTFQQQVNAALLQAARITNPNSQTQVLNSINGVAVIVTAMLALVISISTKAQVAAMAAQSTIKLAAIPQGGKLLDDAIPIVAAHYGEPMGAAQVQVLTAHLELVTQGF
jgi:hypothetical protein